MNGFQEFQMCEDAHIVNPIISIERKKCSKCGKIKLINEFDRRGKDGLQSHCKLCKSIYNKKYYKENYNYSINRVKEYYQNNAEKRKQYSKEYRIKNKEAVVLRQNKWKKEHPNYHKEYYQIPEIKIKKAEYFKNYCKQNPEKRKAWVKRRHAKEAKNPMKKIHNTISTTVRRSLKNGKNNISVFKILGYSLQELKTHLEKQFQPGMTWENYGLHGWHIDHKIPKAVFNFETIHDLDFKKCWELSNLQPLWAVDNLKKQAKLIKPFQPSLALG